VKHKPSYSKSPSDFPVLPTWSYDPTLVKTKVTAANLLLSSCPDKKACVSLDRYRGLFFFDG